MQPADPRIERIVCSRDVDAYSDDGGTVCDR